MVAKSFEGTGNPAVEALMGRIGEIAVLPHVVFKVLEISNDTDSSAADLERAIMVDPAFSAKILAHANSSYYALARQVTSVRDAVMYLGYKALRDIAMTVGVFDMFVGKNDAESLRRRSWWRQSLDTAIVCRYVADRTKKLDSAEAYTCGLLHYIGKSLLDRFGQGSYAIVEQRVALGTAENEAERRVFGCDHEEAAVAAASKWGFPQSFVAAFNYSEEPARLDEFAKYRACVALGHIIAKLAVCGNGSHDLLPDWALEELQIEKAGAQELYDQSMLKLSDTTNMQF